MAVNKLLSKAISFGLFVIIVIITDLNNIELSISQPVTKSIFVNLFITKVLTNQAIFDNEPSSIDAHSFDC